MVKHIKFLAPIALIFATFFSFTNVSQATSGACSWHGGVDYLAGADFDGSVICNDGWRDSSVQSISNECSYTDYIGALICEDKRITDQHNQIEQQKFEDSIKLNNQLIKQQRFEWEMEDRARNKINSLVSSGVTFSNLPLDSMAKLARDANLPLSIVEVMFDKNKIEHLPSTITNNSVVADPIQKPTPAHTCTQYGEGSQLSSTGNCVCKKGYDWTPWGGYCAVRNFTSDPKLIKQLSGKFILQVQKNGEIWYIAPKYKQKFNFNNNEYLLKNIQLLSNNINSKDLNKIPTEADVDSLKTSKSYCSKSKVSSTYKGQLLNDPQGNGLWYVDPTKCRRINLNDSASALQIIKKIGLGVSNDNLDKIPTGNSYELSK